MKPLITFVLGSLTGACLLWFGFSKTVVQLDKHLIVVDRFTGKASQVFISHLEAEQLERDEIARVDSLETNVNPLAAHSEWRELSESEIEKLGFHWYPKTGNQGQFYISFHNPFEKEVWVERVRVQTPPHNDRRPIDREYNSQDARFPPLADSSHLISTSILYEDYYDHSKPPVNNIHPTVATVTPARIWIRK